jgi:ParB/RepB/Spo0J family partition protein
VVVQPRADVEGGLPSGFEYRLLVGHRRFTAVTQLLNLDTIAAHIRGGIDEKTAQLLNLVENLERKSLSVMDEGRALRAIFPEGTPVREMAREISKSREWVRVRWGFQTLPEEIQQACNAGNLHPTDLSMILSTDEELRVSLANTLVGAKSSGETARRRIQKYSKTCRARNRSEIQKMLAILMVEEIRPSPYRALAWASGELSDEEFMENLDDC